jgi:ATP adenylyltransferase
MRRIWSPWRMKYIQHHEKPAGCIFCNLPAQGDDTTSLIIHRGLLAYVILNRYPYTSGHLMVVPFAHLPSLQGLPAEARHEMLDLLIKAEAVLGKVYRPDGFNMGANVGEASGAGFDQHIHFHVVPRWRGDANFMSTLGDTRVLPEELDETYRRVRAGWLAQ